MGQETIDEHYARALRDADVGGLIGAARRFIDAGRLDEAQSALLASGRLSPREGEIYRWLGEVLLRRGDAERAEKVLEKAIQFGSASNAIPTLERARNLIPTQHAAGESAVAELVAQSYSGRARNDITGPFAGTRRMMPPESDGEIETAIRRGDVLQAQIDAVLAEEADYANRDSDPGIPAPRSSRRGLSPSMPNHPPHDEIQLSAPTRALEFDLPTAEMTGPFQGQNENDATLMNDQLAQLAPPPRAARSKPASAQTAPGYVAQMRVEPESGLQLYAQATPRMGHAPTNPMLLEALARPAVRLGGAAMPEARDVLEALETAGIYEPDNIAVPQVFPWTRPELTRRRGMGLLIAMAGVLLVSGVATYVLVTNARARDHIIAEQMLAQVDKDIEEGDQKLLEPAEKSIATAFDLDSRSPHAALTWLHERIELGLLKGGPDIAFEDATARAKEVGVDEKKFAFAHVASFLFQGDTAGAAATVAKWDQQTQDDPWFQLLAGATFERAGDPRALERYSAAVRLAPTSVTAQILLTRAMAVDGDPKRAVDLAKEIRIRQPNRIESAALVLLAWSRDPNRGEPPAEAKDVIEQADALPLALRSVPYAARAILAIPKGMTDEARTSLHKGLSLADTPGMATWLGSIALVTGDEELARKAALAALSFSAAYGPARVLAARVALFAARLDEALKATEDLPPSSPEVAIVTAAASYEKLDAERMSRSLDAISDEAKKSPYVAPLVHGQALMAGRMATLTDPKALEMSDDEAPWADLIAIDWALDGGDLDLAKKIASTWRGEPRAMRAVRLARIARYDGRLDDADKFSRVGLETGTPTMRALSERVYTLVAMKRDADALTLFKAYPNVGGPLAKWLRAYATAMHGKIEDAKGMVSQDDPPPNAAPMAARIIAASAFAAMKDTRHGADYAKPIIAAGFESPDMVFVADRLNLSIAGGKKKK